MHLKTRNVNTAFQELVTGIHTGAIPTEVTASRYGEVMVIEEPVIITYARPWERVLFNAARDANPFFHLYESLWMLAGREDVAPLTFYNKRMPEFSDNGVTFNGAYGKRWKEAYGGEYPEPNSVGTIKAYRTAQIDQIEFLVEHFQKNPESRRGVLSMWTVADDLLKVEKSKDVCCNLSVCFSIEKGDCQQCEGTGSIVPWDDPRCNTDRNACPACKGYPHGVPRYLNMTVFNRSNDLIWGALGANAVHFSFLQEYLAARLGLDIGHYNQVSNNLHAYTATWKALEWLEEEKYYQSGLEDGSYYPKDQVRIENGFMFNQEIYDVVGTYSGPGLNLHPIPTIKVSEQFLKWVAVPMFEAYRSYKGEGSLVTRCDAALHWIAEVKAEDWQNAARGWLLRRFKNASARELKEVRHGD